MVENSSTNVGCGSVALTGLLVAHNRLHEVDRVGHSRADEGHGRRRHPAYAGTNAIGRAAHHALCCLFIVVRRCWQVQVPKQSKGNAVSSSHIAANLQKN